MPNLENILASFSKVAPHLTNVRVLFGFIFLLSLIAALFTDKHLYVIGFGVFIVIGTILLAIIDSRGPAPTGLNEEAVIDAAFDLVGIAEDLEAIDFSASANVLRRARDLFYFVDREDLAAEVRQMIINLRPAEPN